MSGWTGRERCRRAAPLARLPGRRPMRARGGACLPSRPWRPTSRSTTASPEPRRETRCRPAAPCWSWPGPSSTGWRSTWAPCRAETGITGSRRQPPAAPWTGYPRCGWAPRRQRRGSGARCACWNSRRRRRPGRCPASTSSTPAASSPGSERPTPARSAATSCPPRTRSTRSTSRRRSAGSSKCTGWSICMAPCIREPRPLLRPAARTVPVARGGAEKPPPFSVLVLSKNSTPQSSEGFLTNKNSARLYFQG